MTLSGIRSLLRRYRLPVGSVLGLFVLISLIQVPTNTYIALRSADPDGPFDRVAPNLLGDLMSGLNHFDGPEYISIATKGYLAKQVVWFPLYPMSMRALHSIGISADLAGGLITLVAAVFAACFMWRWTELRGMSLAARRASLGALLLYPYAFFLYGVVYSDALFLAMLLGAFVLLESDRPVWAGVMGAFATATRPSGFAVIIGLAAVSCEHFGVLSVPDETSSQPNWVTALKIPTQVSIERLRTALLAPVIAGTGLATYMAYLWIRWDNPLRFVAEQANYHEPGNATLVKQQYFSAFSQGFDGRHLATTTVQLVLLLAALMAVPAVGRRFGWGYGLFVGSLAIFPALSVSTFMGVGRYLLPAFPLAALVGEWLSTRRLLRYAWLGIGGAFMVLMAVGFARNWYLS